MPIKPKYAVLIQRGLKRVEYRRRLPARPFSWLIVYSSSPTQRVVAIAKVTGTVEGSRRQVWDETGSRGGVSRREFDNYFAGAKRCGYICLGEITPINPVRPTLGARGFKIPQSFSYVGPAFVRKLYDHGTTS